MSELKGWKREEEGWKRFWQFVRPHIPTLLALALGFYSLYAFDRIRFLEEHRLDLVQRLSAVHAYLESSPCAPPRGQR
jgi:hypothetical protein